MPTCFVIMPITTPPERVELYDGDPDHFLHVIDYLFKPAIEQAGYEIIKPAFNNSEVIQGEIIRNLETADLVLCDISGWNANVFFELGIRVALDRPVALIRDTRTPSIPFDNAPVSCHQYDSRLAAWCVEAEIPKLRALIEAAGKQQQNALWKYFGITKRAKESDPGDPTQAKLEVLMNGMESLRGLVVSSLAQSPDPLDNTMETLRAHLPNRLLKYVYGAGRSTKGFYILIDDETPDRLRLEIGKTAYDLLGSYVGLAEVPS